MALCKLALRLCSHLCCGFHLYWMMDPNSAQRTPQTYDGVPLGFAKVSVALVEKWLYVCSPILFFLLNVKESAMEALNRASEVDVNTA